MTNEHCNVCDATLDRRADEACSVLRDHIERTGRIVLKALTDKRTAENPAWPA